MAETTMFREALITAGVPNPDNIANGLLATVTGLLRNEEIVRNFKVSVANVVQKEFLISRSDLDKAIQSYVERQGVVLQQQAALQKVITQTQEFMSGQVMVI